MHQAPEMQQPCSSACFETWASKQAVIQDVAQLVEFLAWNQGVRRSSRLILTRTL